MRKEESHDERPMTTVIGLRFETNLIEAVEVLR